MEIISEFMQKIRDISDDSKIVVAEHTIEMGVGNLLALPSETAVRVLEEIPSEVNFEAKL